MNEDYRSFGATRNCHGCRYWSEMIAKSDDSGVVALCLQPDSPNRGRYMRRRASCAVWAEGSLGAIDDPDGNPYELDEWLDQEG